MKRVSVIIPNWNGIDLIGPCLESLYRQSFGDFDVIVVDNGSSDGSVPFIEKEFPKAMVLRFDENRGFSAAVNAGIAASNSPYISLLNNDTEVDERWLEQMVAALEAHPDAGSAASKILYFSDRATVNSAGDQFSLFGVPYQRRCLRGKEARFNRTEYVFSACAAAALYRRQLFQSIGVFDETFFAYQEDVDWGFRAQLLGYRCLFVPEAIVYHKARMTSAKISGLRLYLNQRNKYFVLIKNLPMTLGFVCLPLIVLFEGFCLFRAVWSGHPEVYFKACRDVWRHVPEMARRRREIQSRRVKDDAYIFSLLNFREPLGILFSDLERFCLEKA